MNIIAATPFSLNQGGQIFLQKESGFHQINDTLKNLGEKTADGKTDMICLDAIPSCIAHLVKIHNDMNAKDLEVRYDEERWRKAIVIFALSKYRAYDISVHQITPGKCNPLVWEIFGEKIAAETEMGESIYMLQLHGQDVAVFDKKGYLLPVAEFPREVEGELGENCILNLENDEKNLLFTYLQKLLRSTIEYQYYIKSFIRALQSEGAQEQEKFHNGPALGNGEMQNILSMNKRHESFCTIPYLPVEIPPVFHHRIVLANTQKRGGKIGVFGKEHTFCFEIATEKGPISFSGFLPLSEKMVDFMENDRRIRLTSVEVNADEFGQKKLLWIKVTFEIEGTSVALKKCYGQRDIVYANMAPMVAIFPYVQIPKEHWRSYYMILRKSAGISDGNIEFLKGFREIQGKNIDVMNDNKSCSTDAGREEDRQEWYYSNMDHLPSFIKLCESDFDLDNAKERNRVKKGRYIGCVCVGKPEVSRSRDARTYVWALDMGTRNTIAAWKEDNVPNIFFRLCRDQLYCSLLTGMGSMDLAFAKECYAPLKEINGSFPTMVRLYKRGRENNGLVCYEHGCALFPDLELVGDLLKRDKDWSEAAIITDIKFGENDKIHEQALHVFLFNMLWLGSLECVLNGANSLIVRISYPRIEIKSKIEKIWKVVAQQMKAISNILITVEYCSEAEANARYLQKIMRENPSLRITAQSIFGICDIGDGTSDFNLYLGSSEEEMPSRIQFSMRYAGGDILVETIIKFVETHRDCLRDIWNIKPDKEDCQNDAKQSIAEELLETYVNLMEVESKADDSGKKDKIHYGIQESKRNIILALIENIGLKRELSISVENRIRDFTAVLAFKYWNLFRVYGDMLEKFAPPTLSFKLFFYGGGRKALESVTGEPLDRFGETEFGKDVLSYLSAQAKVETDSFSINLENGNVQKTEVVEGLLEDTLEGVEENMVYSSKADIDGYYVKITEKDLYSDRMNNTLMEHLIAGYQQYIQGASGKEYFELESQGKIQNIYEAINIDKTKTKKNYSLFKQSAVSLWDEVAGDDNNPQCLWEVLFYTKMSNYLLMENVF